MGRISNSEALAPFGNRFLMAGYYKLVRLEAVMTNLFMLLENNGARARGRGASKDPLSESVRLLSKNFANEVPDGVVSALLRANLVSFVHQGTEKERFSAFKPHHITAYRSMVPKVETDYAFADQLYIYLRHSDEVRNELTNWLKGTGAESQDGDLDTFCTVACNKNIEPSLLQTRSDEGRLADYSCFVSAVAETYCEDIGRILAYRERLSRTAIMQLIRTMSGFHLSLYVLNLITYLPKFVEKRGEIDFTWQPIVCDMLDGQNPILKTEATDSWVEIEHAIFNYIEAQHKVAILTHLFGEFRPSRLGNHILYTRQDLLDLFAYSKLHSGAALKKAFHLPSLRRYAIDFAPVAEGSVSAELGQGHSVESDFQVIDYLSYRAATDRFDYHRKYIIQCLDALTSKRSREGLLRQDGSKGKRRFQIGNALLEALVLTNTVHGAWPEYGTQSLSIDEFTKRLYDRYGLVINAVDSERADLSILSTAAYRENVKGLQRKLRECGLFNDLSDAHILQRVRPIVSLGKRDE